MKTIKIQLNNSIESNIIIHDGMFKNISDILDPFPDSTDFIIITDQNIIDYHGESIHAGFEDYKYNIIISTPGEKAKDILNIDKIYSNLLDLKCNKGSCLVAIGGGVIGDITGFVASTFMRGIQYINIPTSLLAMVDSSIGGKTGINLLKGKNLIGSIYHPSKIIIDISFLSTLPIREYYSGMIEIIKYGLILDKNLFKIISSNFDELSPGNNNSELMINIINRCIELKSMIVEEDEKDKDIRNILNFGHTIGHALESYFGYDYIKHGEAVAYGILYSSQLSNKYSRLSDSDFKDISSLINKISLPQLKKLDFDRLINLIMNDKKNINGKLKFILLESIGEAKITNKIDYNNIKEVLKNYEYISC